MNILSQIEISGQTNLADIPIELTIDSLKKNGLALIRGCSVNKEIFKIFTESICSNFTPHINLSREYFGDQTFMSVSAGSDHFFAHSEMAYSPLRPDIAIFFCATPALSGGETTVCDGIEVLKNLSSETQKTLREKKLLFENCIPAEVWKKQTPDIEEIYQLYAEADDDMFSYEFREGSLQTRYVVSAIVNTRWSLAEAFATSLLDQEKPHFSDGSPVPREILWEVIEVSENLMVPVSWQAGDILLVDNSRYMHGRRPWSDDQREILVRFGNVDF